MLDGVEDEEKNLEKMISGGDYSPNSHTFFKHPFQKETTPHKFNTIPYEEQNPIPVAPQPQFTEDKREKSTRKKYTSMASQVKSTRISAARKPFKTKQNSPASGHTPIQNSGVTPQHPLCTSFATITNTTNGSQAMISPAKQIKKLIPDSLIKKANFSRGCS